MKRLLLLLFFPLVVFGQTSNAGRSIGGPFVNRPAGSTNISESNAHNGDVYSDTDDRNVYKCSDGAWRTAGRRTTSPAISPTPAVFDPDMIHAGSNIYADIRDYGAYSTFSSTTCNTTNGSARVRLGAASNFKNGEYATCYNAGPATTVSRPSTPTITPSAHAGGISAVRYTRGSTSYAYKVVAEDKYNGRSAASSSGATSSGATALGQEFFTLTGCTRSNQTVTCKTSATHDFVVGQQIWTQGLTDHTFNGNWVTISPTSNATVTFKSGWDTRQGATTSTGVTIPGTNIWGWKMNRLTWTAVSSAFRYHIYGPNCPSTCNWMGQTVLTFFDDYGATMMASQTRPPYIPAEAPSSSANEHFTFKINAGGGTTTLTASSNAGASVSSNIVSDAGPAILAAAKAALADSGGVANSATLIPNGYVGSSTFWTVNSYTDFTDTNAVLVLNGTGLIANQPLANASKIEGIAGGTGIGNFGWQNYSTVSGTGYPLIYSQTYLKHLNVSPSVSNGGLAIYMPTSVLLNYDDFYLSDSTGGTADCIGQQVIFNTTGTSFDWAWNRFTLSSGTCGSAYPGDSPVPTVVSLATGSGSVGNSPFLTQGWMLNRSSIDVDTSVGACQGASLGASNLWTQNASEVSLQASGTCNGGVGVTLNGILVADFATPIFVNYTPNLSGNIVINGLSGLNGTATGFLSGNPINGISTTSAALANLGTNAYLQAQLTGTTITDGTYNTVQPIEVLNQQVTLGPGYSLFTNTTPGAAPTCSTATAGPPYTTAGTYYFSYAPIWANGGIGTVSFPSASSCSANGTSQQITVTIPSAIPGAKGHILYRNNLSVSGGFQLSAVTYGCNPVKSLSAIMQSPSCGPSAPAFAGGGPAGIRNGNVWAQDFILGPTVAPTGSTNSTQFYMDSTALWPAFKPSGNRAYVVPGISGPVINGHNLCADGTSGAYVDCLTTQTIASGTATLGTITIAAKTCATVVTTAAAGVGSTDAISYSFHAAPSGAYTAGLFVQSYVTPGNVNFLVCNPTAESLTPPRASLNWRVTR